MPDIVSRHTRSIVGRSPLRLWLLRLAWIVLQTSVRQADEHPAIQSSDSLQLARDTSLPGLAAAKHQSA